MSLVSNVRRGTNFSFLLQASTSRVLYYLSVYIIHSILYNIEGGGSLQNFNYKFLMPPEVLDFQAF